MSSASISGLLAHLDPELWLVTAADGNRRGGLIATSVTVVSIVPELPRLLVSVARQHHTWKLIDASSACAMHLLGEDQLDWVWHFGLQSGRAADKLAGKDYRLGPTGSPILAGVVGWLDCRVEGRFEIGDRTLFLAEVVDGVLESKRPALRWQQVVARAPADRLAALKAQRERQAASDGPLIQAWRQENCG